MAPRFRRPSARRKTPQCARSAPALAVSCGYASGRRARDCWWHPQSRRLLVGIGDTNQLGIGARSPDEGHRERRATGILPGRNRDRGEPGERVDQRLQRVDTGQDVEIVGLEQADEVVPGLLPVSARDLANFVFPERTPEAVAEAVLPPRARNGQDSHR